MQPHGEEFYWREISIRFRPNKCASTDHAPGPSIASAALKAPSRTCIQGSLECDRMRHTSPTAISTPATGVHKPTSNSAAEHATTSCRTSSVFKGSVSSPAIPSWRGGRLATARTNKSPVPGQPSGNVAKSRCNRAPVHRLPRGSTSSKPVITSFLNPSFGGFRDG